MALTRCPDCGREVSDEAPSCPDCGRPIAVAPDAAPSPRPAQAIEVSTRRWKKLRVIGTLEVLLALPAFFYVSNPATRLAAGLWIVALVLLGFGTLTYARFGAWRHRPR
jgi:zinc-ribbon domain